MTTAKLTMTLCTSVLMLLLLLQCAEAKIVDITKEVHTIVTRHNQLRGSRSLQAADMMEMRWDEDLAKRAARWTETCQYQRPRQERSGRSINSNLYMRYNHVYGDGAVKELIEDAMSFWRRPSSEYSYSSRCGRACSYVQMIHSRTDRVGCALSTCDELISYRTRFPHSSIFVCLYWPGENIMETYPYSRGSSCSRCDRGMDCRNRLCHTPGSELVPREIMDAMRVNNRPSNLVVPQSELNLGESDSLIEAHNEIRSNVGLYSDLSWSPYLEEWSRWIVNCSVDYPGPGHTFSNFERLDQGTNVRHVVFQWTFEENNTHLRMIHGCRTPQTVEECNHFTNIRQPTLTSMACAARDCQDGTRQLVCLYDNLNDRPYRYRFGERRRASSRQTLPRRRASAGADRRDQRRRRPERDNSDRYRRQDRG